MSQVEYEACVLQELFRLSQEQLVPQSGKIVQQAHFLWPARQSVARVRPKNTLMQGLLSAHRV
jgi:hypothetical protein